jgi:hypothetical protein
MSQGQDKPAAATIAVGDTVYEFDENHRVYRQDANGRSHGSPIHREYWRPHVVVGEEKRSWLISRDGSTRFARKVAKGKVATKQEVDDDCVVHERHKLVQAIQECRDADLLRKVAEVLGYVFVE